MTEFLKYILLAVILLVFLILFVPKTEYFESITNQIIQHNESLKNTSTVLYTNEDLLDEPDFLNTVVNDNPFPEEPMFMNRCIEFINNPQTNLGGIDQVIHQLRKDNRFFISNKIEVDYVDFSSVQQKLKDYILTLYTHTNDPTNMNFLRISQFNGPAYVLITQYPYLRTVQHDHPEQCNIITIPLQSNTSELHYTPKLLEGTNNCNPQRDQISSQYIRCEMYLLLPAHLPGSKKKIAIPGSEDKDFYTVGRYAYKSWSKIKCNMRRLFAFNPTKKAPGVSVIHPRSQDPKCFVKCGINGNTNGYACAARNDVHGNPYASIVLNSLENNKDISFKYDYANLYLLNTRVMNNLLGVSVETGIFSDCIQVLPIEPTFTTENVQSLCANVKTPITGPTDKLEQMGNSVFTVTFKHKDVPNEWCMGVDFATKKLVPIRSSGNIRAISWESTPIQIYTSPFVKDTFYLLSINIPNERNRIEKWWLYSNNRLIKSTGNNLPDIAFYPRRPKLQYTNFIKRANRYDIGSTTGCMVLQYSSGGYTINIGSCSLTETSGYITTVSYQKVNDKELSENPCDEPLQELEFEKNLKVAEPYYKFPVL